MAGSKDYVSVLKYLKNMKLLSGNIFCDVDEGKSVALKKVTRYYQENPFPMKRVNYYPRIDNFSHSLIKLRHMGIYQDERIDFNEEYAYVSKTSKSRKTRNVRTTTKSQSSPGSITKK